MIGQLLGHYRVVAKIGEGGMGEVYRARDTKLDRDVALKVLPEAFTADPDRLTRFEREAKVLASLNHPNIGGIHGLEDARLMAPDGTASGQAVRALVLELVEGPTLADRIKQGPIPIDEALLIAKQIAEALESAHEQGVIHRDLKPANIKVREDGTVKVLDFGLAKALEPSVGIAGDPSQSPTLTAAATRMGVIMGTAAYMSPEQARGKAVDRRADIWAFGAVLFEMLTGQRAFQGEDVSLTLAEVMKSQPQVDRLPRDTPPLVRRLVEWALTKDRARRLQHVGDARLVIDDAVSGRDTAPARPRVSRRHSVVAHAVTALAAMAIVGAGLWSLGFRPPQDSVAPTVTRTTITLPEGQRQSRAKRAPLAISPDGTTLAYIARDNTGSHLYLRRLDEFEARQVPDTEDAFEPFFSPDGEWVGFFAAGRLRRVRVAGGAPLTVTAATSGVGASWGSDDTIVFAPSIGAGLWRVAVDGGALEQLTQPDYRDGGYGHTWPQLLPGERSVLFSLWASDQRVEGAHILDLETLVWSRVHGVSGGDMYLQSGHLGYADPDGSGTFLAAPLDLDTLTLVGSAVPVLDDVRFQGQSGHAHIALSHTGTAVYVSHEIGDASVMWVDRHGVTTPVRREQRIVGNLRLSPNGRTAVFHDEQDNIWTLDLERDSVDALVQGDGDGPIWHPDGTHVTFGSNRNDSWDLYEIDVMTRGEATPLVVKEYDQYAGSWSGDGRLLAFAEQHPITGADVWVLPRGEEPTAVLTSTANEFSPVLSADGSLLAYVSDQTGRAEVYVYSLQTDEIEKVSTNGGREPVWSKRGSELFFRRGDAVLAAVVTATPEIDVATPTSLFERPFERSMIGQHTFTGAEYDVSPTGDRLLVVSERATTQFQVVLNWFEELKRLMPTN